MLSTVVVSLLAASQLVSATPVDKRCVGTIKSAGDVAAAKKCTTINISAFTMPDKTTLDLKNLLAGTVVTLQGNVNLCGTAHWADGPCIAVSGDSITFDGKGFTLDGNGASYWDGQGGNGGVDKPKFFSITSSGTLKNLNIKNTPRHTMSIGSQEKLVIDGVHIDNSAGNKLGSDGKALGHNSDCFDVSAKSLTIQNSSCDNQDDCLAVNKGSDISFLNNKCNGGHGISIGSVAAGSTVSGVTISNNVVTASDNGIRIKTISGATSASVSNVKYTGNTITGATKYGVVIQQDYLNGGPTGKPTNGVSIKDIVFASGNTVSVGSKAKAVYVLCGSDSCTGNWDWSGLKVSGGSGSSITPSSVPIKNFKL